MAEIHVEGQDGTFLTQLGLDFLTALHAALVASPTCFGQVPLDGDTVAGVGAVALDTTQLFSDIKRRHWHRLGWPAARQVLRHPTLIAGIAQSMRYPVRLAPQPNEAEILFMGLHRSYMRQGLAPHLVDTLLDEAYRRGCSSAWAIIDRRNRAIRWTIATLSGIYIDQETEMNDRTILVYRASLPTADLAVRPG